jgi:hypothetical protein
VGGWVVGTGCPYDGLGLQVPATKMWRCTWLG